jgi:hypothetical protein
VEDLTGADGELIERLMGIVDRDPDGVDHWWADVSGVVADAIGGCSDIAPQTDRRSDTGEVAWEHRGNREVVPRVVWMNRLRLRLAGLVGEGMAEDFLVRALRDHVGARLRAVASTETPSARSRYDEWIAEQATGTENLELSLVARALMAPDAGAAPASPAADVWTSAVTSCIDEPAIGAWRRARR